MVMNGGQPRNIQVLPLRGGPVDVFVSYSHEDEALRTALGQHLSPLERTGTIGVWHDRKIVPGDDFDHAIDAALNECGLVLLLVSPPFLASDYCSGIEMTRALERRQEGRCLVIPVILRPCQWDQTPIARIQALPRDATPVTAWANQDAAMLDIANGIRNALREAAPRPAVRGDESYSPSSLVALRTNSLLRLAELPPRSLVLIAPDHAYLGENFAMIVVATNDAGIASADVSILLTVAAGTLALGANQIDREADSFQLVPQGPGSNYMVLARSHAPRVDIQISAEGYRGTTATIVLGPRP